MVRIRLIALAVLAVFCVSAVAAATASASKGEFVNEKEKPLEKNNFTATSGETKLETTSGTKVKCLSDIVLGVLTSATGGEATVHFKTCESSGHSCKSITPAGAVGEIITLVALLIRKLSATEDALLDTILEPGTKKAGITEFECSGIKIRVQGSFYSNGIATNGTFSTLWPVKAKQAKGVQEIQKGEAGTPTCHLETSVAGEAFQESGEEGEETFHFLEKGKFV